jgi:tetratricopeptide (TPR) repeat protein
MSQPNPTQPKPNKETNRLCREAEEAWKRLDYPRSITLLERAARLEPSNPSLYLSLARAHGLRYDYPAAKRYVEKALQISQDSVQMIEGAARICSNFNNLDIMAGCLERASRKEGVSIDALVWLADIFTVDDRIDEAAEIVGRAARINRNDARVLLREAVLKRRRGEINEAESLFHDIMTSSSADFTVRARAGYGLAGILDGAGKYDEAMTALLETKAIQRPQALPLAPQLQRMQIINKEIPKTINTAIVDRWRANAAKFQPPGRLALLTGHNRSGTTLLERVLDAHGGAVSLEETALLHDEIYQPLTANFPPGTGLFQMLDSSPPSVLSRLRENYIHFAEMSLGKPIGDRLVVDKNPGVNVMVPVLLRVFPETKFLIALRDPRDVVMSCFMQPFRLMPASSAYLTLEGTVSHYASMMEFWLEMLPRMGNQWMYVRYEEMIDNLPTVARSVLEFLGLEFEENVLKFFEHAQTRRINSPSRENVRKPIYRTAVGRWKNYQKYLEPYMPGLERFLKEFGYDSPPAN